MKVPAGGSVVRAAVVVLLWLGCGRSHQTPAEGHDAGPTSDGSSDASAIVSPDGSGAVDAGTDAPGGETGTSDAKSGDARDGDEASDGIGAPDAGPVTLTCGVLGWGSAPFGAISPDGKLIALGSAPARIEVQRWSDGSKLPIANGDQGVRSLAFSGDSSLIAASADDRLAVWRISDGAEVRTVPALAGAQAVALSADGSVIAAAIGQSIVEWTAADPNNVRTLLTGRVIGSIAVAPDGSRIAGTSARPAAYPLDAQGYVNGWNTADGSKVWELPTTESITEAVAGGFLPAARVVFSADSTLVARGTLDINPIVAWIRASDGTELGSTDEAEQPWAFTPNNDRLAMTFGDDMYLMDPSNLLLPAPALAGNGLFPLAAGIAPDGVLRILRRNGDTFELYEGGTRVRTIAGNGTDSAVNRVELSADGRLVALAGTNSPYGTYRLWDLAGPTLLQTDGGNGPMALTRDGNVWLRGIGNLVRSERGQVTDATSSIGANGGITAMTISSSGQLVALGSFQGGIELRAVPTLTRLRVIAFDTTTRLSGNGIGALVFSPDESLLAVADSSVVSLWRLSDYTPIGSFLTELSTSAVAFTSDGQDLVTLQGGGWLQVFDVATMSAATVQTSQIDGAAGLVVNSGVAYVAAKDGVLRFSLPDLTPLPTIGGHIAPVISVAVSADGKRVVSGSLDGTARVSLLARMLPRAADRFGARGAAASMTAAQHVRVEQLFRHRARSAARRGAAVHRRADHRAVVEQHQAPADLVGIGSRPPRARGWCKDRASSRACRRRPGSPWSRRTALRSWRA